MYSHNGPYLNYTGNLRGNEKLVCIRQSLDCPIQSLDLLKQTSLVPTDGCENTITHLNLSKNCITTLDGLEKFTILEVLSLNNNNLVALDNGFKKLLHLRGLYLCDNKLLSTAGLENLINLENLWLNGNKGILLDGLETLTNLEELNLDDCCQPHLVCLEKLTKLTNLYIENNCLKSLINLKNLLQLKELNAGSNPFTSLYGIENITTLQTVHLINVQLTSFAGLENNNNLKTLYVELGTKNLDQWRTMCKSIQSRIVDTTLCFYEILPPYVIMEVVQHLDDMDQWLERSRTNLILKIWKQLRNIFISHNKSIH